MANALAVPSAVLGLMGRRPQAGRSLLDFINPMQADAMDEQMFAAAPNGYVESPQGMYFPADPNAQAAARQQVAPQTPQRERVSGWRVLDRVLGGETISGGLDAERARLEAEVMRPQQQERINRVLASINDPREQALFLGLGGSDWQKNVAQQYAPQVGAPGSVQFIGGRAVAGSPQQYDFGDTRRSFNPVTGVDEVIATRGPTYAEMNDAERNRIASLGAGQSTVGRYRLGPDGQPIFEAPSEFTLGSDQRRYIDGQEVAANPKDASDPNAYMRTEQSLASIANTRRAITDAADQVSWRSTGWASNLPFNAQQKADLQATADTIEANLSFTALQQMRDASKTGGALGGIAIRELELLGSTIASLKTSQRPEQFRRNLEVINGALDRWEGALRSQPGSQGSAPPPPAGFVLD